MIHRFSTIGSTNDEAARLAAEGAPAGTAVVADAQTAGRGRAGHCWASPPGVALYVSVVLRPQLAPSVLPLLAIACGIGLAEAVREVSGLAAAIKWPNDILVNGRKCAGILCESAEAGAVICGYGINVNTPRDALPPRPIFPATSLAVEAGRQFDRETLLAASLRCVADSTARLEGRDGPAATVAAFSAMDALRGCSLRVDQGAAGVAEGENAGVAPSGALLLRTADGNLHEIWAGSVSVA